MAAAFLAAPLLVLKSVKERVPDEWAQWKNGVLEQAAKRIDNLTNKEDFEHLLRPKTRCELIQLSAAVAGIELCYAAETAFVSPIYLNIGIPVAAMTLFWCISPLIGFFAVPALGSLSDNCTLNLGRRRPFILLLSCGLVAGLLMVPAGAAMRDETLLDRNSSLLNESEEEEATCWERVNGGQVALTVAGVVLLDLCADACQSPCRAYMLDVCVPDDHSVGLSTFTILAGAGGAFGYLVGGVEWSRFGFEANLVQQVQIVFAFVLLAYLACMLLTVTSFRELPLTAANSWLKETDTFRKLQGYEKFAQSDLPAEQVAPSVDSYGYDQPGLQSMPSEGNSVTEQPRTTLHRSHSVLSDIAENVSMKDYIYGIVRMPAEMRWLCLVNFFCWASLVCYSLYFTDFVGQVIYNGDPSAPLDSQSHASYQTGVRTGSLAMSLYSISCSIYSFWIPKLVLRVGAKPVYIASQLTYTVGALMIAIIKETWAAVLFSPTAGVMYATLFTMPYIIVAHYHSSNTYTSSDGHHKRGIGTDVAVVSSMVFLAQLFLSSTIGFVVHWIGSPVVVMYAASIFSCCGALSATQVHYSAL